MKRDQIFAYVKDTYGTEPDYPWAKSPEYAVLRHSGSRKWYGLIMNLPGHILGLEEHRDVEVMNLKCDPFLIGTLRSQDGFFPAYHMNKEHWITLLLEGPISDGEIFDLIDLSYDLTRPAKNK